MDFMWFRDAKSMHNMNIKYDIIIIEKYRRIKIEKYKFLIEMYLEKTEEIANAWVDILLYRLDRAKNAFEIRALREMVDSIKKLAKSYLVGLRDDLERI
jgi:hypothetical protein